MATKKLAITVWRYSPGQNTEPYYQTYQIPYQEGLSVSNALQYINEHYDGGLAHYLSCRRGICAGCIVRVDGRPVKACAEIVTGDVTIEPLDTKRVLKDLVLK